LDGTGLERMAGLGKPVPQLLTVCRSRPPAGRQGPTGGTWTARPPPAPGPGRHRRRQGPPRCRPAGRRGRPGRRPGRGGGCGSGCRPARRRQAPPQQHAAGPIRVAAPVMDRDRADDPRPGGWAGAGDAVGAAAVAGLLLGSQHPVGVRGQRPSMSQQGSPAGFAGGGDLPTGFLGRAFGQGTPSPSWWSLVMADFGWCGGGCTREGSGGTPPRGGGRQRSARRWRTPCGSCWGC